MSELKNVNKITQAQYDTLNGGGTVGTTTSSPNDIFMEEQASWSSWYSIASNGTNVGFKDNAYYQIQIKNTGSNIIQDQGIFRASSDKSYFTCKFMLGSNVNRLSFYRVATNTYYAYTYCMTGSSWSSLTASSGFMIRFRRVNL